jgi:hypothetical protein
MQFAIFSEVFTLAFLGMLYHYHEKRYDHMTTSCTLRQYLFEEHIATMKALSGIVVTCFGIAMLHKNEWYPTFAEVGMALGVGYGFDNKYNKASDQVSVDQPDPHKS